jgi:hypothetical protein
MPKLTQRIFLGDEDQPSIQDFAELSSDQLILLANFIDVHGFRAETEDILSLSEKLNVSFEKANDLLYYAGYLEAQRARLGLSPGDMIVEFETYLDRHKLEDLKQGLSKISVELKSLFVDRPKIALLSKKATVTAGVVPKAVNFYTLCDLRPVFNEARDEALDYVPVALVRVLVQSEAQQNSSLIFQIDQAGVSQLEECLERMRKKMAFLEGVRHDLLERKK